MPTLLLGDLNEWRAYWALSSLRWLEPVFSVVNQAPPSFPAQRPMLALDRILGCARAEVHHVAVHDTALARMASDHLPMTALVRLHAAEAARKHPVNPAPSPATSPSLASAALARPSVRRR
jgi:endonuclease/exonuclease/phosphatase family metal-dependent hydrolase